MANEEQKDDLVPSIVGPVPQAVRNLMDAFSLALRAPGQHPRMVAVRTVVDPRLRVILKEDEA